MLSSMRNIFRVPDLRSKIIFTLAMLALYRLGAQLPVPGIDFDAVLQLEEQAEAGGVLGFLNLFSGGALTQFALFALGIMPYITASIIMQILTVAIPKLEEWQQQGAVGQRKITQYTRYLTLAIAFLQATGLAFIFGRGGGNNLGNTGGIVVIPDFNLARVGLVVLSLTAGMALLMWIGELISQRGVGNGMSLIIFASVVSTIPFDGAALRAQEGNFYIAAIAVLFVALMVAIVFVEQAQRRIPVQFAKRVVGRRMMGGTSTYIPPEGQPGPALSPSSLRRRFCFYRSCFPTSSTGARCSGSSTTTSCSLTTSSTSSCSGCSSSGSPTSIRPSRLIPSSRPTTCASRAGSFPAFGQGRRPRSTSPAFSAASRCLAPCSWLASRSFRRSSSTPPARLAA